MTLLPPTPERDSRSLIEKARVADSKRPPPPPRSASEVQEKAAKDFGRLLQVEVDPLAVRTGDGGRYTRCSVTVDGVTLGASYLWGGRDYRYHIAGFVTGTVRVKRRWWFNKVRSGTVNCLADIGRLAR